MDSGLELTLIGVSHRTASVGVRERYAVAASDLPACLRELVRIPGVREAAVLSTCNRTEALVCGEPGADLVPAVAWQLFRGLPQEHLYVYRDVPALIHLFRVAAGLDSVVLGEGEVQAQLKRTLEVASAEETLGSLLKPLLQHALVVGKRVRSETSIGQGSLSVAKVAVDVAARVVGRFESCRTLIVGAGETALLVGRHIQARRGGSLCFANRTLEHAEAAARELGARAAPLADLERLVAEADLVFACVEAGGACIPAKVFGRRRLARRDRPLLVVDLSVPRAVEPAARELSDLLLYDLDDLGRVIAENRRGREDAAGQSGEILVAELHKFLALRTYASFTPAIEKLRARFTEVRDQVLDRCAGSTASPKELELSHELARRLLDVALEQLKDSARQTRSEALLDREYQRFLENL